MKEEETRRENKVPSKKVQKTQRGQTWKMNINIKGYLEKLKYGAWKRTASRTGFRVQDGFSTGVERNRESKSACATTDHRK